MKHAAPTILLLALAACGSSEAEEAVRRTMLDPAATQFREVAACPDDRKVVAGEFNAKNRMGGYEGFKPFYYSAHQVTFLADDGFSAMTTRCYGKTEVDPNDPVAVEAAKALEELEAANAALAKARSEAADDARRAISKLPGEAAH